MAKAAKRSRRVSAAGRVKSTRRISTQRIRPTTGAAAASRSRPPSPSARRRASGTSRARATTAAETLQVTLDLRDVADRPIRDPETFFTFRRLSDHRQIGDQVALALPGAAPVFNLPVATGDVAVCEIDPKRYRFVSSPVFFRTPGPPITKTSRLFREPKEWSPQFVRWADLAAPFDDLKRVLRLSPKITLFKEGGIVADLLVDSAYDGMAGESVGLAKTALLNGYFRLNQTREPVSEVQTWFSFVTRIIAIGRERLLAFVNPEMETLVRHIHSHIEFFRADYERTPAENHRGNVPAALQGRIAGMISIKSTHRKGNFQLTLTHLSDPDEVLLDTDIDENGALLAHFFDLFKHKLTGGTHPHDVHELLVLQEGGGPGFDLGYRLA
jgi:hypothetical protein